MDARALLAVACAFLGMILGPHLFALLAFTVAATAVLAVGYCIARVVLENGWGVIPVARARSS